MKDAACFAAGAEKEKTASSGFRLTFTRGCFAHDAGDWKRNFTAHIFAARHRAAAEFDKVICCGTVAMAEPIAEHMTYAVFWASALHVPARRQLPPRDACG